MAKLAGPRSASTTTNTNAQIRKSAPRASSYGVVRPMGKAGARQVVAGSSSGGGAEN